MRWSGGPPRTTTPQTLHRRRCSARRRDRSRRSIKTLYDGAGRQTAEILKALGAEKWRTTTSYGGDRIDATPPLGGTATTTITDVKGRVTRLRQYKNRADVGSTDPAKYDETKYTYTLLGQQETLHDPAGNTWSYTYDLRGREIQSVDPDKGATTSTYDAAGNVLTTTAPLGTGAATLAYTYDEIGRKTSLRDGSPTGAKRAEWVYDTLPNGKGKLTSATRFIGGQAWVTRTDAFDTFGRPTSTSVVVPPSESQLCAAAAPNPCTYTTTTSYRVNGKVHQINLPAAADMPSERLIVGYNDVDDFGSLLSAAQIYVGAVTYNKLGLLTGREFGEYGYRVAVTSDFDEPTRRLQATNVVPELKPEAANWAYDYDAAGTVTGLMNSHMGRRHDTQCYSYDHLRRLTRAWTPNSGDCAASPTVAGLGGPAPYWHSWTFDVTGNRLTETRHGATNTVYTYTHPPAGAVRPHTVTNVTATGGAAWSRNYDYDNAGNTITRPTTSGAIQTLAWNAEGRVDTITEGGSTTSFRYDADGNRLTRTDSTGKTLYLPGGLEVRYTNSNTTKTATRYYSHAGTTVAVRTSSALHWIIADHHGTAEVTINASTLAVAKRRTLPYGDPRGNGTGIWPTAMDKGFVGGTKDPTGLTHIGAREYDPLIGRFLSVDPIMDLKNPQQMHGYAYANNSPSAYSDPSGLYFEEGSHGNGQRGYVTKTSSGKSTVKVTGRPVKTASGAGSTKEDLPRAGSRTNPCATAADTAFCRSADMILNYMHNNSLGQDAATMKHLLDPGCRATLFGVCAQRRTEGELVAGLAEFGSMVCQDCPWDQKPEIRQMFNMSLEDLDSLMMDIPGTRLRIDYDVWSNIHYGYVGTHIGISEDLLMTAQNLPSNPITGRPDKSDAIAVQIGIQLRQRYVPRQLTQGAVVGALFEQLAAIEATGERKVLPQK